MEFLDEMNVLNEHLINNIKSFEKNPTKEERKRIIEKFLIRLELEKKECEEKLTGKYKTEVLSEQKKCEEMHRERREKNSDKEITTIEQALEIYNLKDINTPGDFGKILLHHLTENNKLDLIGKYFYDMPVENKSYKEKINHKDKEGRTPLSYACGNGNKEIIEILLDSGADPNITDLYNKSSLTYALEYCDPETISLLIEEGANPNQTDLCGCSILDIAKRSKSNTKIEIIREAIKNTQEIQGNSR